MRDPKRNPAAYQPFGHVGGQGVTGRRQRRHPVDVEAQRRDQPGHRRQQHLELCDGVEHRLLVLLQIPVIGQGLGLQRRQQAREVADQPARLAPGQLGDVGVLFLRHDRTARRPGVVQGHVAEFRCAPKNDVFGEPGQVDRDHRQHERGLGGEVAGGGRVDRVLGGGREAELLGDGVGVQAQRGAGERARAVGGHRGAGIEIGDAVDVTQQRMCVGEQVMGQQHRLRGLQVGLARHDRGRMGRRLGGQRRDHLQHPVGHPAHGVPQPHPEQGGHLVVARAAGAQPPTEIGAHPVDQPALQRTVDVLVGDDRREAAVGDVGAEAVQPGQQPVALLVGEQPRPVQHLRVRLRRGDVIRRQHPVELGRLAQRRKGRRGSVGEPPAPQRPLVGAHGCLPSTRACGYVRDARRVAIPTRTLAVIWPDPAGRQSWTTARARARSPWRRTGRRCRPRRRWPG